jgi:hypothetical protein
MHFLFVAIIFCFFIFLYILYYISREDFVIIRKDISMDSIFSTAFLTSFIALLSSRLFFVIFNPLPKFLNILGFVAFPYLPGLSLIGGLIGASIFIYTYASFKKMPIGKIFDLFIMAFLFTMPLGFISVFLLAFLKTAIIFNLLFIFTLLMLPLFGFIIYPYSLKGEIKDGSLGLIFLAIFSFLYFLIKLFLNIKDFSFFDAENVILLITLFTSLILLVNQEIIDKILIKK